MHLGIDAEAGKEANKFGYRKRLDLDISWKNRKAGIGEHSDSRTPTGEHSDRRTQRQSNTATVEHRQANKEVSGKHSKEGRAGNQRLLAVMGEEGQIWPARLGG